MNTAIIALRGATLCQNDADDIMKNVSQLYDALLSENSLEESDLVSLLFSVTSDITAMNPAAALRKTGRAGSLPMMCFAEAGFEGSVGACIRVLLHCRVRDGHKARHIYINGAEKLRPDWSAAVFPPSSG